MNHIELKSLSFHREEHPNHKLLDQIDRSFSAQSPVLISGETGSGKTTLMQILAAMRRPVSGECLVNGEDVSRWSSGFRDDWRKSIGILPQSPLLMDHLTVLENIMLPLLNQKGSLASIVDRAEQVIGHFNLKHRQHLHAKKLSGGEAQRVGFARATIVKPNFLFLDEPTAHQDRKGLDLIMDSLQEQKGVGCMIIAVSHDERLKEMPFFEHNLELTEGKLKER